jgi:hypothetical protein
MPARQQLTGDLAPDSTGTTDDEDVHALHGAPPEPSSPITMPPL